MISEADDFSQGGAVVAGRFDAADFADRGEGSLRFDDQPGELDDAASIFQYPQLPRPLEQMLHAMAGTVGLSGSGIMRAVISATAPVSSRAARR